MKKLLLLIACVYAGSTHAMKTKPIEKLSMWPHATPTYADMAVTKLYKEYNNYFSGLTLNERKKRLTEAKNLKSFYGRLRPDTTSIAVIRLTLTTAYFSDLTKSEKQKVHKNPSAKLQKIIKRLTEINRSEQIKQNKLKLKQVKRRRSLANLAKQKKPQST